MNLNVFNGYGNEKIFVIKYNNDFRVYDSEKDKTILIYEGKEKIGYLKEEIPVFIIGNSYYNLNGEKIYEK